MTAIPAGCTLSIYTSASQQLKIIPKHDHEGALHSQFPGEGFLSVPYLSAILILGQQVIVANGGSGLGRECCIMFAKLDAVYLSLDPDACGSCPEEPGCPHMDNVGGFHAKCDPTNYDQVARVAQHIVDENYEDGLAVLVNFTNLTAASPPENHENDFYDCTTSVDLSAMRVLTHVFLPYLSINKGVIINVGLIEELRNEMNGTAYNLAKGMLDAFVASVDLHSEGKVFCTTLLPGLVRDYLSGRGARITATPKAIAEAVLFVAGTREIADSTST
ncbi:hypothetical protein EDC01DRAFT_759984 [Geopyxis carbonaria]|nr:hypothetical protein EDC01DRAFT_759984 [Geopyxis carbonaria]